MVASALSAGRRPEEQLLLACSRSRLDAEISTEIETLVRAGVDWSLVVQLASLHGVRPLLYHSVSRVCPDAVPKGTLDHLRVFFQLNTQRSFRLTAELLKVMQGFRDRGLEVVALKGPALSGLYGHLSLREFADLDLLVERGALSAATDLLASQGYVPQQGGSADDNPKCVEGFIRDGGKTRVEVHWAMVPRHYAAPPEPASLWSRVDRVRLGDATVPSLAPVDLLVFLCLHGAKHSWERLKWICDVAELAAAHPDIDWRLADSRAAEARGTRMLALGLVLASDLLAAPVPSSVLERSRRDPQVRWLARRLGDRLLEIRDVTRVPYSSWLIRKRLENPWRFGRGLLDSQLLRLLVLEPRDRVRYAAHFLQPTKSDREFVPLPARLSSLYYLIRPVRLAWDYGVRPLAHRVSHPLARVS